MKPSRTTGMKDTFIRIGIKKKKASKILHIDNPLMNCGLDTNLNVLRKTEESLRTLYVHRKKLEGSSEMLRLYGILQRLHLVSFVFLLFRLCEPMLRRNLYGRHPNLYFFAFYKNRLLLQTLLREGNKKRTRLHRGYRIRFSFSVLFPTIRIS